VEHAGGHLKGLPVDREGPGGEGLTIDIAWFGAEQPRRILRHVSGTHGVEAFAGSAIQMQLLEDGMPPIPEDGAICLVHVLNPYGMAWLRRANENNVDLNRNFLPEGQLYAGAHPLYRKLNRFLNPDGPPGWDLFYPKVGYYVARYGMAKMKEAVASGQYEYPLGLFYGGSELEAGPVVYQSYLKGRLAGVERLVGIDVHTGLGDYGQDILLVPASARGTPEFDTMRRVYGDHMTPLEAETDDVYPIQGAHKEVYARLFPAATHYLMTQEIGTYSAVKVLHAIREENRWHHHGEGTVGHPAKSTLKGAFIPSDGAWRQSVLRLGRERLQQATGLAFGQPQ